MKRHKYKIGDLVTKVNGKDDSGNLIEYLPTKILDCVEYTLYVVMYNGPGCLTPDAELEPEAFKYMKAVGSHIKCYYLREDNIVEVSSDEKNSYSLAEPLKVDKEFSFYDIVRAETRERIRQEEERRPKNSAFEFL